MVGEVSVRVARETKGRPWRWVALGVIVAVAALGVWAARARTGSGSDPDRVWTRAETDFKAGRYDRTEAALARLAQLRAPTPLDWILKAQMAMLRGRDDEAITDLEHVPDGHP